MHFACLVKQACVDLASDLFVYYRLGMSLYVFGAYKNFESENKNLLNFRQGARHTPHRHLSPSPLIQDGSVLPGQ